MLENVQFGEGRSDCNSVWLQYLLELRLDRSIDFCHEDGYEIIEFLKSAAPAFVDSYSVSFEKEQVESILQLMFDSVDLQSPEAGFTFFCDIIEFKNKQFSCHIELPYNDVELRRELAVITAQRFVREDTAVCIREYLIERVGQADLLSEEELAATALLSAIFIGGLLDLRNQMALCQTSIEVSRGRRASHGDRYLPRIFFPAIGTAWVADPFTISLLEKLSKKRQMSGARVRLCLVKNHTDSTMLSFLLRLKVFFESLLARSQSEKVTRQLNSILKRFVKVARAFEKIQSSSFDVNSQRKLRTTGELNRELLCLMSDFSASFFCFNLRPINLNIALGSFPTACLHPSLYSPTHHGAYLPTLDDLSHASGISNEKLLTPDGGGARAFALLIERISIHLPTGELWKARLEMVKLLESEGDLDNGEGLEISETERRLFEFLIDVANRQLEVSQKMRYRADLTKKQIIEFLNFLSCGFATLLPSIVKLGDQAPSKLALYFDSAMSPQREEKWIELLEYAYECCPKNMLNAFYASVGHWIAHLNSQGLSIDASKDFDVDLSVNHHSINGIRTHYADYAGLMQALDCLFREAKTYAREGYQKQAQICMISYLAGVLYLHFGARLMEVIGLLWFDIQVPRNKIGQIIMRIRPNSIRQLKTGQAPRVFDLRVLPEQLLSRLLEFHSSVPGERGDRPLFLMPGMSVRLLAREVSANITRVIRTTSGLEVLTVHSLRHVALNNCWAALSLVHGPLLPEALIGSSLGDSLIAFAGSLSESDLKFADLAKTPINDPESDAGLDGQEGRSGRFFWAGTERKAQVEDIMLAARYIHRYIYGRHLQPYESPIDAYYLLIKFAGHLEPKTTIRYYLHFLELSLFSDVQKTYPHLKRDQIYRLFDVNKDWVTRRLKDRPPYFSDLQWLALQG